MHHFGDAIHAASALKQSRPRRPAFATRRAPSPVANRPKLNSRPQKREFSNTVIRAIVLHDVEISSQFFSYVSLLIVVLLLSYRPSVSALKLKSNVTIMGRPSGSRMKSLAPKQGVIGISRTKSHCMIVC